MHRHALTDEEWALLEPVIPKAKRGPASKRGDRLFIDAVLYRAKTGIPWRDLPERFGPWKSVYNRFRRWAKAGHWEAIFRHLEQREVDEVGSIADGSVIRAHQDAAGGKGGSSEMLLAALEGVFQRSSTLSLILEVVPSTSPSPPDNDTR